MARAGPIIFTELRSYLHPPPSPLTGGHNPGPIYQELRSYLQHEWVRKAEEEGETHPKVWEAAHGGARPDFTVKTTAKGKRYNVLRITLGRQAPLDGLVPLDP